MVPVLRPVVNQHFHVIACGLFVRRMSVVWAFSDFQYAEKIGLLRGLEQTHGSHRKRRVSRRYRFIHSPHSWQRHDRAE